MQEKKKKVKFDIEAPMRHVSEIKRYRKLDKQTDRQTDRHMETRDN